MMINCVSMASLATGKSFVRDRLRPHALGGFLQLIEPVDVGGRPALEDCGLSGDVFVRFGLRFDVVNVDFAALPARGGSGDLLPEVGGKPEHGGCGNSGGQNVDAAEPADLDALANVGEIDDRRPAVRFAERHAEHGGESAKAFRRHAF